MEIIQNLFVKNKTNVFSKFPLNGTHSTNFPPASILLIKQSESIHSLKAGRKPAFLEKAIKSASFSICLSFAIHRLFIIRFSPSYLVVLGNHHHYTLTVMNKTLNLSPA